MNESEHFTEREIGQLVDQFYAKVRLDPEIGPVFNEAIQSWEAHLALLKDFWSTVLRRTGRYKGNPIVSHLGLEIESRHFIRWLFLFSETAIQVMPRERAVIVTRKAEQIAANLRRVHAELR